MKKPTITNYVSRKEGDYVVLSNGKVFAETTIPPKKEEVATVTVSTTPTVSAKNQKEMDYQRFHSLKNSCSEFAKANGIPQRLVDIHVTAYDPKWAVYID